MMQRPPITALALILLAAIAVAGCRSNSGGKKTPTAAAGSPTVAVTSAATGTATVSDAIRSVDLKSTPGVAKLLDDTGGQYVQAAVIYADVTGDNAEDAVVPIASGGTMGDVAFVVVTDDGSKVLLSEHPKDSGGMAVAVTGGKVVETQPVPGPDDPECCPSMLRVTTYAWNGAALAVESVKTVVNPEGGAKGTPSGTPNVSP
jgi:hypothetical protein